MQFAFFQHKITHRVFAWLLLPLIMLYAFTLCDPLVHNITHIYNVLKKTNYVFLWAFSSASYFYIYTRLLMQRLHYHNPQGKRILMLSCLAMIGSIFIPYDMEHLKLLSNLHLLVSISATSAYILLLFHIFINYSYIDVQKGSQYLAWYSTLLMCSGGWIFYYGTINTLSECCFVLCISLYLYWLLR